MDDLRIGHLFRAVRRRLRWRQVDVALRARVSQQLVALIEAGRLESVTVRSLRAVAATLEIRLPFVPQWRGGTGDALLDARHAAIVNAVVAILRRLGWTCVLEYTFSHYGERGSVDILAWHPRFHALLIIEVKSRVLDTQALFLGLDRKARLVPGLVAGERGWTPLVVGRVVVLDESHANRTAVRRHADAFSVALPAGGRDVRKWLREPSTALAGLWFLTLTNPIGGKRKMGGAERVRSPRPLSPRPRNTAGDGQPGPDAASVPA
jgi:transcriptional regulator with XRE-family HTH domain